MIWWRAINTRHGLSIVSLRWLCTHRYDDFNTALTRADLGADMWLDRICGIVPSRSWYSTARDRTLVMACTLSLVTLCSKPMEHSIGAPCIDQIGYCSRSWNQRLRNWVLNDDSKVCGVCAKCENTLWVTSASHYASLLLLLSVKL